MNPNPKPKPDPDPEPNPDWQESIASVTVGTKSPGGALVRTLERDVQMLPVRCSEQDEVVKPP